MKFRKKPVVIEAERFYSRGHMGRGPYDMGGPFGVIGYSDGVGYWVETLEGRLRVIDGDWIIRGTKGEFYPCKADIFEATYEAAEATV